MYSHGPSTPHKAPSYKEYRAMKFKQNNEKVQSALNSIRDSSLNGIDKKALLEEIRLAVSRFELK